MAINYGWIHAALDCPEVADDDGALRARQAVARFKGGMKVCWQGIDMLGSAARGEWARRDGIETTNKRAGEAQDLVRRIHACQSESSSPEELADGMGVAGQSGGLCVVVRCEIDRQRVAGTCLDCS